MRKEGIKCVESYSKIPALYASKDISEEHIEFVRSIMSSEGYDAVVLTTVKDKQQTVRKSTNGYYVGASFSPFHLGYYGGFYDYYSHPYAYGPYYSSFGGFVPTSTTTKVETNYVIETVAYSLDEAPENQLIVVITTSLNNPTKTHKTAEKYVDLMMKHLDALKD